MRSAYFGRPANNLRPLVHGMLLLILGYVAVQAQSKEVWMTELPTVGTFSSPRMVDLNGDGVKDVVMGAGREEFQSCDTAVLALDGITGAMLWSASASDQIFGSAMFLDVTGDGTPEVFIAGRSAELMALDGRNGALIWSFREVHDLRKPAREGWYNFYNPQFIPDQDADGIVDLLVSNGGDVMAEPYDPDRPAGQLVVISSRNGALLHRAMMPDDKEIYMSITVSEADKPGGADILFGTGGETIAGALYRCPLQDFLSGDLSTAHRLDSSLAKGYIGPAVRADITGDGFTDVLTNAVDGRCLAFDGVSGHLIWDVWLPNTESYSSVAVGYFNADETPDVFLSYGRGVWPHLGWGIQKMVDGKDGQVLFTDSLGFYQNTSPLAVDLNGDGRDEVVMSLNFQEVDQLYRKFFYTMLISIDFATGAIDQLSEVQQGSNLSSTPWIGDMDGDGFLDIVYCHGTNLRHTYTFDGMQVHRLSTRIPAGDNVRWGAYQGNEYDGLFQSKRVHVSKRP